MFSLQEDKYGKVDIVKHYVDTDDHHPFSQPLRRIPYVTGSAKTRHNRASLNFQYKALNAVGETLAYFKKYYRFFLNALFEEKETSNNKNLDII